MTSAELDVIGSMLIDSECIEDIMAEIVSDDFSDDAGKSIFTAICSAWLGDGAIDPVILAERCGNKEHAEKLMLDAMELVTTTANALEYAAIVKSASIQRRATAAADKIALGYPLAECLLELQEIAAETSDRKIVGGTEWKDTFSRQLAEHIADPDSAFCKTGYSDFDRVLGGGMVKGGLYILGARPGMGKTTFAINIAEKIAKRGQRVLLISLEMSPHQIMCKRVALDSNVQYERILYGKVNEYEQTEIAKSLDTMADRPFYTNAGFSLTVADIGNLAKRCKGCACLVIDYFGLISPPDDTGSRYEMYSIISRQLKQLAGSLNIPILCLAQLNREVEKGHRNKKPQLSDLRDTGSLEQDADAVIFLHRDKYYNEDGDESEIDIIVRKNRHGTGGEIKMQWYGKTGQICQFSGREEKNGGLEF